MNIKHKNLPNCLACRYISTILMTRYLINSAILIMITYTEGGLISTLIDVFDKILYGCALVTPLNINMCPIFEKQLLIVGDDESVINCYSTFIDCGPGVSPSVNWIALLIKHCSLSICLWEKLGALVINHARRIWVCSTTWTIYHVLFN